MKTYIVTFHRSYEIKEEDLRPYPDNLTDEEFLEEVVLDSAWKSLIDDHEEFLHDVTQFVSYTIEEKL